MNMSLLILFLLMMMTITTTTSTSNSDDAILVSGGLSWNSKLTDLVDVFIPSTGEVCSFTPLPWRMFGHAQEGLMICGGYGECPWGCDIDAGSHCFTFSESESWAVSNQLAASRDDTKSWKSSVGVVLFYGHGDFADWTELVRWDGTTELLYSLEYVNEPCLIPDDETDSVLSTGGRNYYDGVSTARVTRYNLQGFVEELPQLNRARSGHGCASYVSNGERTYLVTGGDSIGSTELFILGSWQESGRLPYAVYGLVGTSLKNDVYMLGGGGCSWPHNTYCPFILKFDDSSKLWEWNFNMTTSRGSGHAVTTVNLKEIGFECGNTLN